MSVIYPGVPDLDAVPDLTDLPPRRPAKRSARRERRAEEAMARAERRSRRASSAPAVLARVEVGDRPHVRLGLAWATVTVGAATAGTGWLAGELALVASVAAGQMCRVWRRHGTRPNQPVAMAGALALPLAALAGPEAVLGASAALVPAGLVVRLRGPAGNAVADVARTVAAALPAGLAAASVVLVRDFGRTEALVMLALVLAFDAGSFVVGSGAGSRWEGPAAGIVCTVPVTLVVATFLVDPFAGSSPWALGALVAVTAPLGPLLGTALLGAPGSRAPALGRLDVLLAAGPLWAWSAAVLL